MRSRTKAFHIKLAQIDVDSDDVDDTGEGDVIGDLIITDDAYDAILIVLE